MTILQGRLIRGKVLKGGWYFDCACDRSVQNICLVTAYLAKLLHLTAYHASDIMNATLKVRFSDRAWSGALLAFVLLWRCSEVSPSSWYGSTIWVSDWMWWCSGLDYRCLKCPIKTMFFIGPESDHWLCLSVTHSLSHSVAFSRLDGCEWCQLLEDVATATRSCEKLF